MVSTTDVCIFFWWCGWYQLMIVRIASIIHSLNHTGRYLYNYCIALDWSKSRDTAHTSSHIWNDKKAPIFVAWHPLKGKDTTWYKATVIASYNMVQGHCNSIKFMSHAMNFQKKKYYDKQTKKQKEKRNMITRQNQKTKPKIKNKKS